MMCNKLLTQTLQSYSSQQRWPPKAEGEGGKGGEGGWPNVSVRGCTSESCSITGTAGQCHESPPPLSQLHVRSDIHAHGSRFLH